jgi:hypothetical protein
MITKNEFLEKFPDVKSFEKEHPKGEIFKFHDRKYWEIRGYMDDEFPDGEKLTLVSIRTFVRYKDGKSWVKHWKYDMREIFDFYCVYDFCKREYGDEFNKESWDEVIKSKANESDW